MADTPPGPPIVTLASRIRDLFAQFPERFTGAAQATLEIMFFWRD
ncbi:hypothetical protein AB4Y63_05095 [Leifsonia sp. YAF41]